MTAIRSTTSDRIKSAIAAIATQALIGYALIAGLAIKTPRAIDEGPKLFRVAPLPPPLPERSVPPPERNKRPEGAASPPNLRSKATEIIAPIPVIRVLQPSPVVVADKPGVGAQPTSGTADIRGPGTGSGGVGDGTGSGGTGNGDGGGYGDETPPRRIKGALKDSDYPSSASEGGFQGTVSVRFLVAVTGRVTGCDVTRSSGDAEIDATTCRLIEKRYRYDPSRDARGRPVPAIVVENHSWVIEDEPPAPSRS